MFATMADERRYRRSVGAARQCSLPVASSWAALAITVVAAFPLAFAPIMSVIVAFTSIRAAASTTTLRA